MAETVIQSVYRYEFDAAMRLAAKGDENAAHFLASIWDAYAGTTIACFTCNSDIDGAPKTQVLPEQLDYSKLILVPVCATCWARPVDGKTECVHRDPQGNVCTARKAGSLQFLTKENDAFAVVKRVRAHYWETRRFAKMHPGDPAGAHLRAEADTLSNRPPRLRKTTKPPPFQVPAPTTSAARDAGPNL